MSAFNISDIPDTLGMLSNALASNSATTAQAVGRIIDKVFSQKVTEDDWANFCTVASEEFLRKQFKIVQNMFQLLRGSKPLTRRLSKSKRLRQAWAAYAARIILTYGTELRRGGYSIDDEDVLVNRLEYDEDNELRQKLVVSLTGDMDVDLKTNFIARSVSELDTEPYMHFLEHLYCYSVEKMAQNIRIGFGTVTFLPEMPASEEGITAFFDSLAHVEQPCPTDVWTPERRAAIYGLYKLSASWISAFTMPASITTADGKRTSCALPGLSTAGMAYDVPDSATAIVPYHKVITDRTNIRNNLPLKPMQLDKTEQERLRAAWDYNAQLWAERRAIEKEKFNAGERVGREKKIKKTEDLLAHLKSTAEELAKQSSVSARAPGPGEVIIPEEELERLRRRIQLYETKESRQDALLKERDKLSARIKELEGLVTRLNLQLVERDAEVRSLSEALFNQDESEDGPADSAMTKLDISVLDGLKIVVVGGTPAFTKILSQLHSGIRCFGTGRVPEDVIGHADVVWMQSQCISHKYSWIVTDTCRKYSIPIRFFKSRSAQLGCKQMIQETADMRSRNMLGTPDE